MRITVLLHSTTGNTRVVTRYAARRLEAAGHDVVVHDIVKERDEAPELTETDCLCVACPTMYFRPTFAMERAVARLPNVEGAPRPAMLLATCLGEPGAHFALLAELLAHKGWVTLGATWVIAPSNWPTHLAALRGRMESTNFVGDLLCKVSPRLRPLWGTIWPDTHCGPGERERDALDRFLEDMARKAEASRVDEAPTPKELHHALPICFPSGRLFHQELIDTGVAIRVDPATCTRCGTCVKVCPAGIITQAHDEALPEVAARGCTGCYACYNHCPDGALLAAGTPAGKGRYRGPTKEMRELFRG